MGRRDRVRAARCGSRALIARSLGEESDEQHELAAHVSAFGQRPRSLARISGGNSKATHGNSMFRAAWSEPTEGKRFAVGVVNYRTVTRIDRYVLRTLDAVRGSK